MQEGNKSGANRLGCSHIFVNKLCLKIPGNTWSYHLHIIYIYTHTIMLLDGQTSARVCVCICNV